MGDAFSFLTEFVNAPLKRLGKLRTVFLLISLALSIAIYEYFINPLDANLWSVWNLFENPRKLTFIFYTGNPGGIYNELGIAMQESSVFPRIEPITTGGGYENAVKVLSEKNAFGLVQRHAFDESDFVAQNINFITPLYAEHLQIVYRKDSSLNNIVISNNMSEPMLAFFANAKINTGAAGSGSKNLSSLILSKINEQISDTNTPQILDYKYDEARQGLENGSLDIAFF
ncbi:MAG: TAXI family TRAP transporter solute-binding subunit [Saprospiraceae bacterium]